MKGRGEGATYCSPFHCFDDYEYLLECTAIVNAIVYATNIYYLLYFNILHPLVFICAVQRDHGRPGEYSTYSRVPTRDDYNYEFNNVHTD